VLNYSSNLLFAIFYTNYSILINYLNGQNNLIVSSFISLAFLTIFLNISKFDTTICFDSI